MKEHLLKTWSTLLKLFIQVWASWFTQEKAVQPVASLPVNYSLLEIAQNMPPTADAEEHEEPPSSPTDETAEGKMPHYSNCSYDLPRPLVPPRRPSSGSLHSRMLRHSRTRQDSSSVRDKLRPPPASSSAVVYTSFPTPVRNTLQAHYLTPSKTTTQVHHLPPARNITQAHNLSDIQTRTEKELQDELDFQMAIHLTFCKVRHFCLFS